MALNFPSSPSVGQMFQAPDGKAWLWTFEGKWRRMGAYALPYNRVVNPSMQVTQQNYNNASNVVGYYAADQWPMSRVGGTGGICSVQRVAVNSVNGSRGRIRMTTTTAQASLAAGDYMGFYHRIEGNRLSDFQWGRATARRAVLRFGMKAPAGTWAFSFRSGDTVTAPRAYSIPLVVPAGSANTDVEYSFSIPGPIDGSFPNNNTSGLELWFTFAAGTNYAVGADFTWRTGATIGVAGQSNGFASTSNVFEIFDVGLYADPLMTGVAPPYQVPNYEDVLYECMRYWYPVMGTRGQTTATNFGPVQDTHPTPMRVTPALALVGTVMANDLTTNVAVNELFATGSYIRPTEQNFEQKLGQAGTSWLTNRPLIQYITSDSDYIAASARM